MTITSVLLTTYQVFVHVLAFGTALFVLGVILFLFIAFSPENR